MRSVFCFIVFIQVFAFAKAQDFVHYTIGKEELAGAEVYSILPTQNGKLYVSTDIGFFEYKRGKMNLVPIALNSIVNGPLFNLVENENHQVFGADLEGTIYTIKNDSLKHYRTLPKKYIASKVNLAIDNKNRLVIASKGCIALENEKIIEIYFNHDEDIYGLSRTPDGKLWLTKNKNNPIGEIIDNGVSFFNSGTKTPYIPKVVLLKGKYYGVDNVDSKLHQVNSLNEYKVKTNLSLRYAYQFIDEYVWLKQLDKGIAKLQLLNGKPIVSDLYFKDRFISEIRETGEGVLYLGTFSEGVLVVPNFNMELHQLTKTNQKLLDIEVSYDNEVFVLDRYKGLFSYKKGKVDQLLESSLPRDRIFYDPEIAFGEISKKPNLYFQGLKEGGAEKDIAAIDSQSYLVASSIGIKGYGDTNYFDGDNWTVQSEGSEYTTYKPLRERCTSIIYDKVAARFYVATLSDIYVCDNKNIPKKLLFKNKSVQANAFEASKDTLWIATTKNGLLYKPFKENSQDVYRFNGITDTYLRDIKYKNNQLFLAQRAGFRVIDLKTKSIHNLGSAEGFNANTIKDFAISRDKLWLIQNNQLVSISLENLVEKEPKIDLDIESITVESRSIPLQRNRFQYDENDFSFTFDYTGVVFEKETLIHYRLDNLETSYHTVPASVATASYNLLPPGKYSLRYKASYRRKETAEKVYTFEIAQVFWKTNWFISLSMLIVLLGIGTYFWRRQKRLQQKAKEQLEKQQLRSDAIASELKAIRAQMNPHFIFNSLNAIQDLVLKKDTGASYDYIEQFSMLIRKSLNFSERQYITLAEELEFLRIYLNLAQLRFEGKDFSFNITNAADTEINIPSLLLQPFVENALNHGLFHKKGKKELEIQISQKEETLFCLIKDNGVGRAFSKKINEKQFHTHQSFAMKSIQKRLNFLASKTGVNSEFTVTDLYNEGKANGTKVEITIPLL